MNSSFMSGAGAHHDVASNGFTLMFPSPASPVAEAIVSTTEVAAWCKRRAALDCGKGQQSEKKERRMRRRRTRISGDVESRAKRSVSGGKKGKNREDGKTKRKGRKVERRKCQETQSRGSKMTGWETVKEKNILFLTNPFPRHWVAVQLCTRHTPFLANYLTKQRSTTAPRRPDSSPNIKRQTWWIGSCLRGPESSAFLWAAAPGLSSGTAKENAWKGG